MKANELMIGDFVRFKGSDLYHQVHAVQGKSVKLDKQYWYKADKLLPIPITKEILEKNGFSGEMYAFCKINDEQWLEYYYHEHRLRKWWRGIDERNNHADVTEVTFECQCHYVHELQMAFKLCKVNKEIVL